MSRVQSVNTLALAHPCLLAGPKGVGPFYCPAEPINTMRCCHALDPRMPTMSSTGFDSCRSRRASDGPIRSRRRSPYPQSSDASPQDTSRARTPRTASAGTTMERPATTLGRGAIRRRVVAIASGAPMAIRVQKGGASGDWQRASWHDAGLLLKQHSSDAVLPCLRSSEVHLGRRFPLVG